MSYYTWNQMYVYASTMMIYYHIFSSYSGPLFGILIDDMICPTITWEKCDHSTPSSTESIPLLQNYSCIALNKLLNSVILLVFKRGITITYRAYYTLGPTLNIYMALPNLHNFPGR